MPINLSDVVPAPMVIGVGRGDVSVKGLTIENCAALLAKYSAELKSISAGEEGREATVTALVQRFPTIAREIIAMSIDAVGQDDAVSRIPVSAQLEILIAVWDLTVTDPKKLMEKLAGLADAIRGLKIQPASPKP